MNTNTPAIPQEQGRGTLILILGVLSLVTFGPILGIPAWVMGKKDLKKIEAGMIPMSERSSTKAGMILGIIGTFLIGVAVFCGVAVAVFIAMMGRQ